MRKKNILFTVFVCLLFAGHQLINAKTKPNGASVTRVFAADNAQVLPIRRVILYSNGVAYIERRGFVSGNTEVDLEFKQSQVDDVLKSMIVLDLGKGRIGAVSYNSSAPPSARMAEIPFSVRSTTNGSSGVGGIAGVLSQLQGAKVLVTTKLGPVTGAILTVEKRTVKSDKTNIPANFLVIATQSGEILNFNLSDVKSVKLLDTDTRRDIREFASASASSRRRDAKTITVTSEGAGRRELVVSYTISAPIWKTTYRVVLDDEGKPFFQGWAVVDNVSEEDWKDIKLSLVSGSPVSFIQNIQKPFYRYRPVVPMPGGVQVAPQTHETGTLIRRNNSKSNVSSDTLSGVIVDSSGAVVPGATVNITNMSTGATFALATSDEGKFSRRGLPAGRYNITVTANGFKTTNVRQVPTGSNLNLAIEPGDVTASVTVTADDSILNVDGADIGNNFSAGQISNLPNNLRRVNDLLKLQPGVTRQGFVSGMSGAENIQLSGAIRDQVARMQTSTSGEDIGDLFEYKIDQPVTVMRNRSALIPIIQTKIEGERVSIYNESYRRNRPLGGMILKNSTPLTFESGSLTVIDRNAYAGEALMRRLKPKERRLISYSLDLGTYITVRNLSNRVPSKLVKVVNGVFQVHFFRTNEKTYEIKNQTDRKKVVYVEYPIKSGWKLSDKTQEPESSTQQHYRFRVELEPNENKKLNIVENRPQMQSYQLSSISRTHIDLFVKRSYIDPAMRAKLEKLIELRGKIATLNSRLNSFNVEEQRIARDQLRLRKNIEALAKTPEAKQLITRYVQKADRQETRIEEIMRLRKSLSVEKQSIRDQLSKAIKGFEFEQEST